MNRKNLFFVFGLVCLLLQWPVGASALNSNTTMYGVFQQPGNTFLGKARIQASPIATDIILSRTVNPSIQDIDCAACVDGIIYTLYANPISYDYTHQYELRRFNALTGAEVGSMTQVSPVYVSEAQATDPLTGRSWGRFAGNIAGDRWEIAWVDYRSMERHAVGQAQREYICMGMTTTQQLYGVGKDGRLYQISTTDGTDRLIGELGIDNYMDEGGETYHMNGAINPEDNQFYMTFADVDLNTSLLRIDLATGKATKVADFERITLSLVVFFPENNADNGTPAEASNVAAEFSDGGLTGHVSFTMPTATYDGQPLSGDLDYVVNADARLVAQGTAAAGQQVTTADFAFTEEGMHGVEIVVSNSVGSGAHTFKSFHVGLDVPGASPSVTAELDARTGGVKLSWQSPAGINGGYVGDLTYTVTRYPDNVVVATAVSGNSASDQLSIEQDIRGYSYGVVASNRSYSGAETVSNKVVYGASLDVPYTADFGEFDLFTTIDTKNDGKSFAASWVSSSKVWTLGQFCGVAGFAPAGQMDDWLVTPKINFEAGKTYRLTIPQYMNAAMKLSIAYGEEATEAGLTGVILPETAYGSTADWGRLEREFQVAVSGSYHVGIHAVTTESAARGLFIRNALTIEEVGSDRVPQAPVVAQGKGGDKGAKTLSLKATAPTKNIKGEDLTEPLTLNLIYRNRIVSRQSGVEPGQTVSLDYENQNIADGFVSFSVTATTADGTSAAVAVAPVYMGYDTPVMSGAVTVQDGLTRQTISWQPVSELGREGYYVDPAEVEYIIYDVSYSDEDDETVFYDEIARVKGQTTFVYEDYTTQGEQHETYKGVRAVNRKGQSDIVVSTPLIKGAPYGLPFTETLAAGYTNGKLWWTDESKTTSEPAIGADSYDLGSGSFTWTAGTRNESVSINTGKISLRGASNKPVLTYAYFGEVGDQTTITAYAVTPDGTSHQLNRVDFSSLKGDDEWRMATCDLTPYRNEEYVMVKFLLQAGRRNESLAIDAISIYNMLQYNLSVDISAPEMLKAGADGTVSVTVSNTGENAVNGFTVRLLIDDDEVFAETVTEPLATQAHKIFEVPYKPSPNSEDGVAYLRAEVEALLDLDDDDNWIEAEVEIRETTVAQPLGVTLTGTTLSWQSPGETTEDVLETFEDLSSYANGGVNTSNYWGRIGDWTVYDGDGDECANFVASYPGKNTLASSWIVWDTATPSDEAPKALLGSKYMVSFTPIMNSADDWLISPQLSGSAQAVVMQVACIDSEDNTAYGQLEVLYSTQERGTSPITDYVKTFQRVATARAPLDDWSQVEVQLPAGAKYFAVRNVSTLGVGVALSLVEFEKGYPAPVSFNVYDGDLLLGNVSASSALTYVVPQSGDAYGVTAVYANGDESKRVVAGSQSGIAAVAAPAAAGRLYDLQGRAVNGRSVQRGLYIVNGKKLIVK